MSSATATIPWRLRNDVEVHSADEARAVWTIKDPVKLNYFQVGSEELEFLRQLDGRKSLGDSVRHLATRYPEVEFSEQNLQMFLVTSIKAGLLVPSGTGYGRQLAAMERQRKSSAVYRKLFSLISHRFRGIDPTPLLKILDRTFGWIFTPSVLWLAATFVVVSMLLVLSRWTQLQIEMPTIQQLVSPQNILMLGIAVAFIKVLHEIGHGLTCQHYGGECHELGCMVIGFLPLLYCDVSDSWLQRNRIRRVQVAAAGIAVELFLAAVFGLLWIASVPGTAHTFFLNVMLICSLNTVLVNGNPLLRYDGYYVLSDLLRLPNLGAESRAAALSVFDRVVLGVAQPGPANVSLARQIWLPTFGAASMIYRLVVVVTILLFIRSSLKPYRLEGISYVLALSIGAGLLLGFAAFARQRISMVYHDGQYSKRALIGLAATALCIGCVLFWPFAYTVEAPFTLTPGLSSPIFVSSPGKATHHVKVGDIVREGQNLVSLQNSELDLLVAQAEGELELRGARVLHLTDSRSSAAASASALPAAEDAEENAKRRLATLREKVDRLLLQSPTDGIVYSARSQSAAAGNELTPKFWSGTPLDAANEATWLPEQTLVCWVGTPSALRAVVYVSQEDVEFVEVNAVAELTFRSLPGTPISGRVVRLGNAPEASAPAELLATRTLSLQPGSVELSDIRYAAYTEVDQLESHPPLYSTGFAQIKCRPTSLAERIWRVLSHTFAFEL